ncbi:HEXXH motif domain-containing protein [Streptosporangium roseum]|uniref:HEXXH motif domain-containing protein n=1 Tax=Streptosporangium roseum TaxID=2001 RepID=UPI003324CA92
MNLREHRIPADTFSDLAAGGGGVTAARLLAATQYSKHVLLVRGVVDTARATGHPQAGAARRGYDLLTAVQAGHPEAVDAVLRYPSVGAWARHTVRRLSDPGAPAVPAQLGALAAAAALRAGTACTVEVPVTDGVITLPSVGQVLVPGGAAGATIRCSPAGAEVVGEGFRIELPASAVSSGADAPGWRPLRALTAEAGGRRLRVLVDDLDPYRMPGSAALSGRLNATRLAYWQSTLDSAWELLVRHHTAVAGETATVVSVLAPMAPENGGQSSASSRETFGCVALSEPLDGCSLAVTLAHEVQHAKLSALLDVVTLLAPDDGSRHYAPWRDDPRPLGGLLQGAYAYLGVTEFWRRQRAHEKGKAAVLASAEFAQWREAARMVCGTLAGSGRLTEAGEIFVTGMIARLDGCAAEPVPDEALTLAHEASRRHRDRWAERNRRSA